MERFTEGVPDKTADDQVAAGWRIVGVADIDAVIPAVGEVAQEKSQGLAFEGDA